MDLVKQYVKKRNSQFFASIVLAIVGVVANLFSYVYMAKIIVNLINKNASLEFYFSVCLIILLMFVAKEIAAGVSSAISHTATFNSLGEIRNDISNKLFKMPLGDVMSRSSGELKNIIVEQVDSMETSLAHLVPEFTANLVGPILLLVYMFLLDWRLTLLSLIPLAIGMSVMMSVMNDNYKDMFQKSVSIGQRMNNAIVEYINGIKIIKTFNQSSSSYEKFSDAVYDNAQFYCDWMGQSMNRVAIGRLLSPMGIITIIPFGILFYMNGSIDLTSLMTLIVLSFATVSSIVKIMNYMDDLSRISTITGEIEKILNSRELKNKEKGYEVKEFEIELENIVFSYDGEGKIIDDISLSVEANSVSALVGPSGSGKSTIAKLIAGFWNIDDGKISIGGVDTEEMSLERLSSLISYVSQDNFLFDISVRDNIRLGNKEATDKEVEEIAKKSGCHDFILNLSNGYDTIVGEGGGHLSGGERQRISIARAMLKDGPIIILDEATSYIDPENEAIIQEAISNLVKGKTLLIIAHRLRTITDVDRIFVISNGKLENFGTHSQLLDKSDLYRQMYEASMKGEE
ncbi:ABC transporter ATP-binding protein [Anaerosphaera multitolerans]|uniref:ABC transporter ATP-binding protein n=1 Tax=Anaerosphaera multitolerans TaxID=2487351 RepID=A0A437S633_9FIRM|nr:ABC transporter ATP-binding protein [Anaerosphaera multitolerans]RVU54438.1 ABC transporter ATP-binding protein [Anaerosphaera multitolerans]